MPASKRAATTKTSRSGDAPDFATVWYELGTAHLRAGRLDDAVAAFDNALKIRPAFPEALRAGGCVLRDRGATDAALRFFGEAIRLRPAYLDAVLDQGGLLQALGRLDEALATYDAALRAHPAHAGLLSNKGAVLHSLGRLPEACTALRQALRAVPTLPQAQLNLAGVLMRMFRHDEALPLLDRLIAQDPGYAAAHANRGLALKMLGRFAEAGAALDLALAQEPDSAYALTNRGELRLLLGDYERGWIDYQARLSTEWQDALPLTTGVPLWRGEELEGLRVLAIADAGHGDVLHFARYVPMLVAAGARVTVICRPRLHRLLKPLFAGTQVVETIGNAETFDCLIPFTNLPFVFSTTVATIPGSAPYLAAEPALVEAWRKRLGEHGTKIGLCWRGNQDWRADPHRSIPLGAFAPLASTPGVRLISLHPDHDPAGDPDIQVDVFPDVDAGADGFIDTAAIMANLDLVVTIDTSIAHLAGALGRPTALLLRKVPEWRWLLQRDDTPWYPSVRLFRQSEAFAWTEPLERLATAMPALLPTRIVRTGEP